MLFAELRFAVGLLLVGAVIFVPIALASIISAQAHLSHAAAYDVLWILWGIAAFAAWLFWKHIGRHLGGRTRARILPFALTSFVLIASIYAIVDDVKHYRATHEWPAGTALAVAIGTWTIIVTVRAWRSSLISTQEPLRAGN